MNVNSFQDHKNATLDQVLPSNRLSITKQYQAIDQASSSKRPSIEPSILPSISIYTHLQENLKNKYFVQVFQPST